MIDFRIERGWSFDGYQMWVIDHRSDKTYIAKPFELQFEPHNECTTLPEPTFRVAGPMARELLTEMRKALAGFNTFDKENYEASARIEKAMQAHIDSLKLVVDRVVKRETA